MHELLQRLGQGDTQVMEMCRSASNAWRAFLDELQGADTGTLSARLGFFERDFKRIWDSTTLGETMMPWTGFAALYDTKGGWGQNVERARQLAEAFARSHCSNEVKSEARSAIISYELEGPGLQQAGAHPKR